MGEPYRVQLRRTKGWRMPENSLKVDRSTRWGNPYTRQLLEDNDCCGCPNCVLVRFERSLTERDIAAIKTHLRGKNLACWCPLDAMCHADLLLAIANDWDMRTLQPKPKQKPKPKRFWLGDRGLA